MEVTANALAGSQHGQGTAIIANTAPPAPASRSQAGSKPKGLPVPRGKGDHVVVKRVSILGPLCTHD